MSVFKLLTAEQFKAVLASPHLNTRYEEQVFAFLFAFVFAFAFAFAFAFSFAFAFAYSFAFAFALAFLFAFAFAFAFSFSFVFAFAFEFAFALTFAFVIDRLSSLKHKIRGAVFSDFDQILKGFGPCLRCFVPGL